jgi:hypothetical protein
MFSDITIETKGFAQTYTKTIHVNSTLDMPLITKNQLEKYLWKQLMSYIKIVKKSGR